MFSIAFDSDQSESSWSFAIGTIVLGGHRETFHSPTVAWSEGDYEGHWTAAARRILDGADRSAFITSYEDPATASHLVWWPAYAIGDSVKIHNQLLFLADLEGPFTIDSLYERLRDYRAADDEGQRISEWSVELRDLEEFVRSLPPDPGQPGLGHDT